MQIRMFYYTLSKSHSQILHLEHIFVFSTVKICMLYSLSFLIQLIIAILGFIIYCQLDTINVSCSQSRACLRGACVDVLYYKKRHQYGFTFFVDNFR